MTDRLVVVECTRREDGELSSSDFDCVDIGLVAVVVGRPSTATFCVLVVASVDGGGSALSLCMRPICMRTPRLFLNLLPHTLHVHNSEVCAAAVEEVAHVIAVSWSVLDEKVENTLELICQVIGGFS